MKNKINYIFSENWTETRTRMAMGGGKHPPGDFAEGVVFTQFPHVQPL